MIDIKKIANNKDEVIENLNRRGKDYTKNIEEILENYTKYLEELQIEENLKSSLNTYSKEIGILKKEGKDVSPVLLEIDKIKEQIANLDSKKFKDLYEEQISFIPNLISEEVPAGKDDEDNLEVEVIGDLPKFDFEPKDHYEVSKAKENFYFEKAGNISKSRFVLTTNFIAKLERAIASYMLDVHTKNGYNEISVPFIVNSSTLQNSGNLPKFANDLFKIENNSKSEKEEKRDFYLIPTAETVLANVHRDEILKEEDLTLKYTAYSQCFRKEAGSAGKDTSGIIRMHQFGKVELFKYTTEDRSDDELKLMVEDAKSILDGLKLPYRVVLLCSGDIGFSAHKTYDLEVWFPGQNKYRECSSCSNVTDFQARRGKIRYKDKEGKKKLVHMLNGSGMATGRILAAVIENYQTKDGDIIIPDVLQKYFE